MLDEFVATTSLHRKAVIRLLNRRSKLAGRKRSGRPWRGLGTTKPGTLLKNAIPIQTFSEWEDSRPGSLEVDLVAHCGESSEEFYLTTLSTIDVVTGWYEPVAVWGKGQDRVGGALYDLRKRLSMPMLGLDSDKRVYQSEPLRLLSMYRYSSDVRRCNTSNLPPKNWPSYNVKTIELAPELLPMGYNGSFIAILQFGEMLPCLWY